MATPPAKFRHASRFDCDGPSQSAKNTVCPQVSSRLMRSNQLHTRKLNSTKIASYAHRHYHMHESMIRIQQLSIPSRILPALLLIFATGTGPAVGWAADKPNIVMAFADDWMCSVWWHSARRWVVHSDFPHQKPEPTSTYDVIQ